MPDRLLPRPCLLLAIALLFGTNSAFGSECHGSGPGATLLYPYISVDFTPESEKSSLISISNTADQQVLTHVIVWSNCGLPIVTFPLALAAQEVRSLSLHQLLVEGRIPGSGPVDTDRFTDCPAEIVSQQLDDAALASLEAKFTGDPDPIDGLCYANAANNSPALGYVTVDVLNNCPIGSQTPLDDDYFVAGGLGLAGNDNVLTGDFFLLDGEQNSAQGFAAVSLAADATRFVDSPFDSFWGRGDDRYPLSNTYRTRFLEGGDFDGGTDLLYWINPDEFIEPGPLSPPCSFCRGSSFAQASAQLRDEKGLPSDSWSSSLDAVVGRLRVGVEVPSSESFGSMDFSVLINCGICSPPFVGPAQTYLLPVYTAEGKFSAGMRATPLVDPCDSLP